MVCCLTTGARAIWNFSGYDTKALLIALAQHTSIYSNPVIVLSVHGSQMVATAKENID